MNFNIGTLTTATLVSFKIVNRLSPCLLKAVPLAQKGVDVFKSSTLHLQE